MLLIPHSRVVWEGDRTSLLLTLPIYKMGTDTLSYWELCFSWHTAITTFFDFDQHRPSAKFWIQTSLNSSWSGLKPAKDHAAKGCMRRGGESGFSDSRANAPSTGISRRMPVICSPAKTVLSVKSSYKQATGLSYGMSKDVARDRQPEVVRRQKRGQE